MQVDFDANLRIKCPCTVLPPLISTGGSRSSKKMCMCVCVEGGGGPFVVCSAWIPYAMVYVFKNTTYNVTELQ